MQQAEPGALRIGGETEQADFGFANVGLDGERRRLADLRQGAERARRTMDLVADAIDIEQHPVVAESLDQPLELADHSAASRTFQLR